MSEQVPGEERDACAHCRGRGGCARNVCATCDVDGVSETDGCLVLPEVLRPAPGEGISARLIVPHVGKVLHCAPVGKDREEARRRNSL